MSRPKPEPAPSVAVTPDGLDHRATESPVALRPTDTASGAPDGASASPARQAAALPGVSSASAFADQSHRLRAPGQSSGEVRDALAAYYLSQRFSKHPGVTGDGLRVIGASSTRPDDFPSTASGTGGLHEAFTQLGTDVMLLTPRRAEDGSLVEAFPPGATLEGDAKAAALRWTEQILSGATRSFDAVTTKGQVTPFAAELGDAFADPSRVKAKVLNTHSSNTLLSFELPDGPRLILKLNRGLSPGDRREGWMNALLAEEGFTGSPKTYGSLVATVEGQPAAELALLQEFVENKGEVAKVLGAELDAAKATSEGASAPSVRQLVAEQSRALAKLHATASRAAGVGEFHSRPATRKDREAQAGTLGQWLDRASALPEKSPGLVEHEALFRSLAARVAALPVDGKEQVLPTHTDLHDMQIVLAPVPAGEDHPDAFTWTNVSGETSRVRWVTLDYGPEPARVGAERLELGPAVEDLAGILCSKDFGDHDLSPGASGERISHDAPALKREQLAAYLQETRGLGLWPKEPEHLETLLLAFLLRKTAYEDVYFANAGLDACREVPQARYAELAGMIGAAPDETNWLREAIQSAL